MQYFNIQVASQLSGVAAATIRAWEKRYHAVTPDRSENGHRLYSDKDISKLALLFRLTEIGQSIGKIAHLSLDELKDVYKTLMHEPYEEKQVVQSEHDRINYDEVLSSLFLALRSYKVDVITHELEKIRAVLGPRELCLKIIVPLFHEIGHKVERKELTIAQEHVLSAITTFYIGQMLASHYQKSFQREDLVLLGTPAGELHDIGTLAAALLCVHYGFRIIYMGPNLPADTFAEAANTLKANAILIGTTRFELREGMNLAQYVQNIQENLKKKTEVWIGGNINQAEEMQIKKQKASFFTSLNSLDTFLKNF